MAPRKKPAAKTPSPATTTAKRPYYRATPEQFASAKIIWESDPSLTLEAVADMCKMSFRGLRAHKEKAGWRKITPELSGLSKEAMDEYNKRRALIKEPTEDLLNTLVDEIAAEFAMKARTELLEKHKKEWEYPRSLAYQAIKDKNFDLAKLAKISSETIRNTQDGERKAWGLDKGGGSETNIRVVIERE